MPHSQSQYVVGTSCCIIVVIKSISAIIALMAVFVLTARCDVMLLLVA